MHRYNISFLKLLIGKLQFLNNYLPAGIKIQIYENNHWVLKCNYFPCSKYV